MISSNTTTVEWKNKKFVISGTEVGVNSGVPDTVKIEDMQIQRWGSKTPRNWETWNGNGNELGLVDDLVGMPSQETIPPPPHFPTNPPVSSPFPPRVNLSPLLLSLSFSSLFCFLFIHIFYQSNLLYPIPL